MTGIRSMDLFAENQSARSHTSSGNRLAVIFALLYASCIPVQAQVPITFDLDDAGYLTLVIEKQDADGDWYRVRNLIADTYFEGGDHTIMWDGYDNGLPWRDLHGNLYDIARRPVSPGTYRARGLFHEGIQVIYEFSVYQPPGPEGIPFATAKESGTGWLGEHGPPVGAVFLPDGTRWHPGVPQMMITSLSGEIYANTAYIDLDGNKLFGHHPGHYIVHLATRDRGTEPLDRYVAYVAIDEGRGSGKRIRVQGITGRDGGAETESVGHVNVDENLAGRHIGGIAVYNGLVLVTNSLEQNVAVFDAQNRREIGIIPDVPFPRGIEFGADGRLYMAQGANLATSNISPRIVSYAFDTDGPLHLRDMQIVVDEGLEHPQQIRFHGGEMYVGDWGFRSDQGYEPFEGRDSTRASHQIKVFGGDTFELRRTIGSPGGPQLGRYDETRMHRPQGFDIDLNGQLWVAERDMVPKRVSVWEAETGSFIRAIYGNSKYGGGGTFHPEDPARFFYAVAGGRSGMRQDNAVLEFHIDWETGDSWPTRVLWRAGTYDEYAYLDDAPMLDMPPETPLKMNGRLYFTNTRTTGGGMGPRAGGIWIFDESGERLRLVSAVGIIGRAADTHDWEPLGQDGVREKWHGAYHARKTFFAWSDRNDNGHVDPDEIEIFPTHPVGQLHSAPRLAASNFSRDFTYTESSGWMVPVSHFTDTGIPVFDLDSDMRRRLDVDNSRYSVDGDGPSDLLLTNQPTSEADSGRAEWAIGFGGPITGHSLSSGKELWRYHAQTPSPASCLGPDRLPRMRGEILCMMRPINLPFAPSEGEAGDIIGVSAYHGSVHLLTADGLYLTDLGADARIHGNWMDIVRLEEPDNFRGTEVTGTSMRGESYHQTLNRLPDGRIILQGGGDSNLFEIKGLETARRLDFGEVLVFPEHVAVLARERTESATESEDNEKRIPLDADISPDGDLSDWADSLFVSVDAISGISAALASDGDYLFAAWRTGDSQFLNNPGSNPLEQIFRGGGGLDLFIADSENVNKGNPRRAERQIPPRPHAKGDFRIFITNDGGTESDKFGVYLYERMNPAADPDETPHPFYSPIYPQGVPFARFVDISDDVSVARKGGDFEVAIPLRVLEMYLWNGKRVLGDIGVVVGNGRTAIRRAYWNNHSRTMTNDLPTEAEFWTQHMGIFSFVNRNRDISSVEVEIATDDSAPIDVPADVHLVAHVNGNPTHVDFFVNREKVAVARSPPYAVQWRTRQSARVYVTARAYAEDGRFVESAPKILRVSIGS